MKTLLALLLLVPSLTALANEIERAYRAKDFKRVAEIYQANPKRAYTTRELMMLSLGLRKNQLYRQDIMLNVRIIKKEYGKLHKAILSDMKQGNTIDADAYPKSLKIIYWNLMNDYGRIMQGYKDVQEVNAKDRQHYASFSKLLSELEFREKEVDKLNDEITAHIQYLENKVYKFTFGFNLQYLSWQQVSTLEGPTTSTSLIVTNRGYCAGVEAGVENYRYHYYVDACLMLGSGGVSSTGSAINYQQSNIPAYGVKGGPGISMIVSSSRSRIGIKLPVIYNIQELSQPRNAGYSVKEESPVSFVATLYSRWQFEKFFLQTEFGQYVQKDQTLWSLGIGKSF